MNKRLWEFFKLILMTLGALIAGIVITISIVFFLFYLFLSFLFGNDEIPEETVQRLQQSAEQHLEQVTGEDFVPIGVGWGYLKANYWVGLKLVRNPDVTVSLGLTEYNGEISVSETTVHTAYHRVVNSDARAYYNPLVKEAFKKKVSFWASAIFPHSLTESREVKPNYEELKQHNITHDLTILRTVKLRNTKEMKAEARNIFNFIVLLRESGLKTRSIYFRYEKNDKTHYMKYMDEGVLYNINSYDDVLVFFLESK